MQGFLLTLPEIARALGGEVQGNQVLAPSPGHSGKDRGLSVWLASEGRDGFTVFSHNGADVNDCRDYVRSRLGMPEWKPKQDGAGTRIGFFKGREPQPAFDPEIEEQKAKRRDRATKIWSQGVDPRGTLVETYLASRGLDLPADVAGSVIRFHGRLPWKGKEGVEKHPAMIVAMTDIVSGEVTAVHRTILTADGQKIDRRMLGISAGTAMRLHAAGADISRLSIAEGVETALAARQFGFDPVWALGSVGEIERLAVIEGVAKIRLLEEIEDSRASVKAVATCAARWHEAGRQVEIVTPTDGGDANDAFRSFQDGRLGYEPGAYMATRSYDPATDDQVPVIRVVSGEMPRAADETEDAVMRLGMPIFVRAGELVHPITDTVPAAKDRTTTVARLKSFGADSLADVIGRQIEFQRFDKRSEAWVTIDPPSKLMLALLARDGRWKLPPIVGVITTPTLRPDGSLLSAPGYDPATRLYLSASKSLDMPEIPDAPTRADAERALKLLTDLLANFPFVGPVDRAVALSGIITAVVRGAISVAPLHAIRAHTAGTGKSFLVDIASTIATGRLCPVIAAGKSEEETEKRLGSLLRDAAPIVSLDNVNGELGGDALCQMTERPLVRIRILGKSETPEFECKSTIFATGNNLTLVGDMTRRTILCSLDAGVERPELREFSFDPVAKVHQDRGAYVAAAIIIARAYRSAGSPNVCRPIGSYGDWSQAVRAPLIWLGEADPVASMETARDEDPELLAIRELFTHWREHLAELSPYTAVRVIEAACERNSASEFAAPEFRDVLLRVAGDGGAVSSRKLGRWLTRISGRMVDGTRLTILPDTKHGNRFSLARAGRPGPETLTDNRDSNHNAVRF